MEVGDYSGAFHLDVRVGEINRGQRMKAERKWPCHQVKSLGFNQNSWIPFFHRGFLMFSSLFIVSFSSSNKSRGDQKEGVGVERSKSFASFRIPAQICTFGCNWKRMVCMQHEYGGHVLAYPFRASL